MQISMISDLKKEYKMFCSITVTLRYYIMNKESNIIYDLYFIHLNFVDIRNVSNLEISNSQHILTFTDGFSLFIFRTLFHFLGKYDTNFLLECAYLFFNTVSHFQSLLIMHIIMLIHICTILNNLIVSLIM